MNILFFNETGVLRSGWRVAIFLFFFFLALIFLSLPAQWALALSNLSAESQSTAYFLVNAIISLIPAILVGWLCGRLLEKLPFRSLGAALTDRWFTNWLLGLVIGAVTLSFGVLIAIIFGGLRFNLNPAPASSIIKSMAISLVVFSVASAFEEALFRGYILQTFARSGLAWSAIFLTSLFFGAVHASNPNANEISIINTILAGVWFSVAYLKTRDLWFVWGLHLMWNWMQGSIYGIEVSGLTKISAVPLLMEIDSGPTWLTGDNYGIEGGIVCTISLLASIALIYYTPHLKPDKELLELTSPATNG